MPEEVRSPLGFLTVSTMIQSWWNWTFKTTHLARHCWPLGVSRQSLQLRWRLIAQRWSTRTVVVWWNWENILSLFATCVPYQHLKLHYQSPFDQILRSDHGIVVEEAAKRLLSGSSTGVLGAYWDVQRLDPENPWGQLYLFNLFRLIVDLIGV